MGRYDLKHIDKGIVYLPVDNDTDVDKIIKEHRNSGKTIVLFRSGKYNMKNILKEFLKTRVET